MDYVTIYSQEGKLLGVLENADEVSYSLVHNDLWTASFSLPTDDPKNALCEAYNIVRIPESGRDIGLYRIIGMPTGEMTAAGGVKTYSLEHVMATLLDDVLFGYHEIGGPGVTTAQVIAYILDRQTDKRWTLGRCDFSDQYAYKFENVSLLSALLSLGNVLTEEYTWQFDTSTTPWRVNLVRADATPGCGIHYMRNMVGIEKSMDASTLVTRLYLLGYGEGINQLTIRSVNGGVPYIDADTASKWGIKASVYADTRIEDAATLKARGLALLERLKNPYFCYTASAIDLASLTGQAWDAHMPGKLVRVTDDEHGVCFAARVVSISKQDVRGSPGDIEITIANAPRDAADSINTLADRMGITELYSQGATNLYSQQYADNADADHPAAMRVYIPSGCVRINSMLLSWQLSAFRAYETGAAAGGGRTATTQSGGASTQTSEAGGACERTSRSGGQTTMTVPGRTLRLTQYTGRAVDTEVLGTLTHTGYPVDPAALTMLMTETKPASGITGVSAEQTTGVSRNADGPMTQTGTGGPTSTGSGGPTATGAARNASGVMSSTGEAGTHSHSGGSHRHGSGDTHRHTFDGVSVGETGYTSYNGSGYTTYGSATTGDAGSHTHGMSHWHALDAHEHSISRHAHDVSHWHQLDGHTHTIGGHAHDMSHRHNMDHQHVMTHDHAIPPQSLDLEPHSHVFEVPEHTHRVRVPNHTHELTLSDHTHDIVHGIYEGKTASKVTLRVDGNEVPASAIMSSEMDIVAFLAKDDDGKITRGTWHEIELVPDGLTRIEANLFVQAFVQSVGGGDY